MSPRLKTCDYTPEGRLSRRTWARGATDAYDHRGRMLSKEILPTSTNSTFSTLHSTFVWDGWNIIRETTSNLSTFQPFNLSTFAYANDAAGRRVSRIDTFDGAVTTNTFGYNARSEVTSALMGTNAFEYAYDHIGNRVESSRNSTTNLYSANCLNQYTAISNLCASVPLCEPTYDADGNTTSDGRGWHYVWNGENRMVCASNDEVVVTYAYDHRGRMVQKDISRGDTEAQRIGYVWDNWNIICETATDHSTLQPFNLSTSYVWGLDLDGTLQGAGGVGGLLAVLRDDGIFLPTYDANGNITEYLATNGTVAAHYEYSAFGEPIVSDGELAASFTHQFSTKPYCAITGFNEYVYRKYMAEIGRWMSRDPIHSVHFTQFRLFSSNFNNGLSNLYSYGNNSSIMLCDKLGLEPIDTHLDICCKNNNDGTRRTIRYHFWENEPCCNDDESKVSMSECTCFKCGQDQYDNAIVAGSCIGDANTNGHGDAFRHCYGSCRISKICGNSCAFMLGWGNEIISPREWLSDSPMDIINNSKGRGIASSGQDCATGCLDLLYGGGLQVDDRTNPPNTRDRAVFCINSRNL